MKLRAGTKEFKILQEEEKYHLNRTPNVVKMDKSIKYDGWKTWVRWGKKGKHTAVWMKKRLRVLRR